MKSRIFCAVDTRDPERADHLAGLLGPEIGGLKLGLEFFNAQGPDGVRRVMERADDETLLFLDLKLHDIPNTVANALRSVMPLKPDFVTIHAGGGLDMMKAAVAAAQDEAAALGTQLPKLLGVTVLTNLDDMDLSETGVHGGVEEQVRRLADLAQLAGMDGVICSPREIEIIRNSCGVDFTLVVPGIRPASADISGDDQKRTLTPGEAMTAGADYLVIGRPLTQADDPAQAARDIVSDMMRHAA